MPEESIGPTPGPAITPPDLPARPPLPRQPPEPAEPPAPPGEKRLTFGEHLEDLRTHIIRALYGFALAIAVALWFQDPLMAVATRPHRHALELVEQERHPGQPVPPAAVKLKVLAYPESIMAHIKLALIAATFFSSPWIFYQLWSFVAVGLYKHEKKYVLLFAPLTFALFCIGIVFGYFALIPFGLYYLASFGADVVDTSFTLDNYLDFFLTLTLVIGLVFELPLVMLFAAKVRLASARAYLRHWRIAVLVCFIVAAVATPGPDPISQCLLAFPLVGLYFLGILLSKWMVTAEAEPPEPPEPPAEAARPS